MDRLDELAVFAAIVEAGSLAEAARRLRRSPPAVTRCLAALEDRLGVRLAERTTRRLVFLPTQAGGWLSEAAAFSATTARPCVRQVPMNRFAATCASQRRCSLASVM